ncbi:MAG: hypothetical protein ACJ72P_10955, partial [Nocardioides sp.]
ILISFHGGQSIADDHVGAHSGEDWFDVSTEKSEGGQQSIVQSAETTGPQPTYSYEPVCVRGEGIVDDAFYGCGGQQKCGEKGHVFYVWAHYPSGGSENLGAQCFEPDEAPVAPERQVTQAMVLRAFQRIPVPASRVEIQPPGGKTLVNLETIFSTEAEEFTRTIGLLGHRVDLAIAPSRFEWVTGDGADFATEWAGRAWEKGVPMGEYITHNYADAADVTTRVDTTWSAKYRVDGGDWQDVGGTVTIEGEPFDLAVLSAAPHLVS